MAYNYQAAKQAGLTDQEINAYLASKGQAQQPQAQPKPQGGGFSDYLPLLGAIGGSFLPGLGTIAGGALGAGAGTLFKQGIQNKSDLGEVAKETAMGGLGGVFGKVASPLFRGATKALGAGAENVGENLAVRALRPTKTQLFNFGEKHGVDLGKYIQDTGLVGKDAAQIASEHIQPLQDTFNSIAKNVSAPIDRKLLNRNFAERITELLNTGSSDDAKIAEGLMNEAKMVNGQLNKTGDTFAEVNRLRQNFDSKVKDWLGNPIEGGKNRLVGSALRDTLQQSADTVGFKGPNGESLKDMGLELSKLYSVKDIADLQSNLGRGTLPLGLSKLLGIAAGGAATGGGLPGAAVGLLGATALNNPRVIGGISKGASALGGALGAGAPAIGQGIGQTIGQVGAQNMGLPGVTEAQASKGNPTISSQLLAQGPDQGGNIGMGGQPEPGTANIDQLRKAFAAMILSNPKQSAPLMAAFKLLSEGQNAGPNVGKVSAKDFALAKTGIKTAKEARQFYKEDPSVLTKQLIPGQWLSRKFDSALYDAFDTLLRLRTGAQANPTEIRGYMQKLGPTFGDSPEVFKYKMDKLESDLKFYQQGGSADTNLPYPQDFSGGGL